MLLCLSTGLAAFSWSHFWVLEKGGEQAFCWIAAWSGARYASCADIRLNRFMHEYTVFGTAYLYGIRYEELLMTAHPPAIMNYQSSSAKRDGIDRMCPGS